MHDRMANVGAWLRKVGAGLLPIPRCFPETRLSCASSNFACCRLWQSVLVRRSQRAKMRWERFTPVLNRWIPPPRVLHPYPDARFYAIILRKSRMRTRARTDLCGGDQRWSSYRNNNPLA